MDASLGEFRDTSLSKSRSGDQLYRLTGRYSLAGRYRLAGRYSLADRYSWTDRSPIGPLASLAFPASRSPNPSLPIPPLGPMTLP
ncbi:MAG: hypothetical protein ACO4AJ_09240, partial [Prochlorothrix sp.]